MKALQATARVRVRRQPGTIKVAVTGTSGKTTTKEAVAAVLRTTGPTLATHGNHNDGRSRSRAHRAVALEIFRDQSSHGAVQSIADVGQVVGRSEGGTLCTTGLVPTWVGVPSNRSRDI